MNEIKCECGHVNPEGTVLCEACGKPIEKNQHLDGNDKRKLLNMRYEGSARRSQTYTRTFVDKTWSFFSSVKVGIWLIVIALIASALGTIFPQEMHIPIEAESRDPAIFYEAQFGILGKIYYQLGLYDMYGSWWYMILIGLIGVSLVICSIDRFVPLYRALRMQKAKRHETFVSRQRLFSKSKNVEEGEINTTIDRLKQLRYNVRVEDGHVLAEKGRFSRWGPYVNHIGLIIILIAAVLRMTPLFLDEYVWVREGERTVIPGTDGEFYIENKSFTIEVYDAEKDEKFKEAIEKAGKPIPKNYQSDVIIYQAKEATIAGEEPELIKYTEDEIRMNHPLKFASYTLYQAGYQLNEFNSMTFKIYDVDDPDQEEIDSFTIDDLMAPQAIYELESGFKVEIEEYYSDYYLDEDGPRSETRYPRNPAFVFFIYPPGEDTPEVSFVGIGRNIGEGNQYKLGIIDFKTHSVSGLTVRRDYTLPIFALGAIIFMVGVIQGMYWQHRRIWIHPKDNEILLGAHTNKNWFGIKKDIEKAIKDTNINMVEDFQELDE